MEDKKQSASSMVREIKRRTRRVFSAEEKIKIILEGLAQNTAKLVEKISNHLYYPKLFSKAFPGEPISTSNIAKAIAQFLRTIVSDGVTLPDSISSEINPYAKTMEGKKEFLTILKTEIFLRGTFFRFARLCSPCHGGKIYGNEVLANNLVSTKDTFMKAPALINIILTGPYMHDGRFTSVERC